MSVLMAALAATLFALGAYLLMQRKLYRASSSAWACSAMAPTSCSSTRVGGNPSA